MQARWIVNPQTSTAKILAESLKVPFVIGQILAVRGFSVESAKDFLFCETKSQDPFLLPDMEKSVARIVAALSKKEQIVIYGDYDVDGQTGTALLLHVLRSLTPHKETIQGYIPHRIDEGYGINEEALREFHRQGVSLVVSVDCGISALIPADVAKELGLSLIITDHHEVGPVLPSAFGIVSAKRRDSIYPNPNLAGCGVAYKLAEALGSHYGRDFREHLDLVALGTVADLVPLLGENRFFVKEGLTVLRQTQKLGLRKLMEVSNTTLPTSSDLAYRLGPRLNAVGRLEAAEKGVLLLTTEEEKEAETLANLLETENQARKELERGIFLEAVAEIEEQAYQNDYCLVLAKDSWHPGVIGIVASRLVEKYYRPTFVIGLSEGVGKGSARSIPGFNLYSALTDCKDHLLAYGGHEAACGFSLREESIDTLRCKLNALGEKILTLESLTPKVLVDAKVELSLLDEGFIEDLKMLEPFGMGNPHPVFLISGSMVSWSPMGDGSHLRGVVREGEVERSLVGFRFAERMQELEGSQENLRFLVDPTINEFRNQKRVQLLIRDMQSNLKESGYVERALLTSPLRFSSLEQTIPIQREALSIPSLPKGLQVVDARNSYHKYSYIGQTFKKNTSSFIYVPTAKDAVLLCQKLRVQNSSYASFLGFAHPFMPKEDEKELRDRLAAGSLRYVVTPSFTFSPFLFDEAFFLSPPPRMIERNALLANLKEEGSVHLLYGYSDYQECLRLLEAQFPNREGLLSIYRLLPLSSQSILIEDLQDKAEELGRLCGLTFALEVFAELSFLSLEKDVVLMQQRPAGKLDLSSSLRYNRGMEIKRQAALYWKQCVERKR